MPRKIPLARLTSSKYERPGVYLVVDHSGPLYVGETFNVKARVEQMLNTELWMKFAPQAVRLIDPESAGFVDAGDPQMQRALQSHLVGQTNPLLNSVLLRPDYKDAA
jgi:excinuclease UvrABC nuclease subunit